MKLFARSLALPVAAILSMSCQLVAGLDKYGSSSDDAAGHGGAGAGTSSWSGAGAFGAGGPGGAGQGGAVVGGADLVGYWKLDEGAGSFAEDSSGHQNRAELVNGPTWDANGIAGSAVRFDGMDDTLLVQPSPSLDLTDDFTLAGWMFMDTISTVSPGKFPRLFQKGNSAASSVYGLNVRNDVTPPAIEAHGTINGTKYEVEGTQGLTVAKWYHFACVREGGMLRLYVNGALEASASIPTETLDAVQQPLAIGKSPGNTDGAVDGLLDDLRVYGRALSQVEIQALYAQP